jgi:hypothetical protein
MHFLYSYKKRNLNFQIIFFFKKRMKINANLEIVNNLAIKTGYKSASRSIYSQLSLAKDQSSNKYFLIINNTKKAVADKFKVIYF